ncbi:MAG: ion transporter [Balneolales bacterium]|nr:ion transporter [Balneolales bacterium]
MTPFAAYCKKITETSWFNNFILFVILLAGVVVGIQTYGEEVAEYKTLLFWVDQAILFIFLVEIFMKMAAEGNRPLRYFNDPWNIFDFTIVAVCYAAFLVPDVDGFMLAVFRLARVLRVFRVVRTIPKLQLLVNALLKSIPSIGYVGVLLGVIFYIYATMGVFLFKYNDPVHFGNLQLSLISLFRIVTLEDWTDIMYINMYGCDHTIWGYTELEGCVAPMAKGGLAITYFVSFVIIGTMVVLNLFIGVIMNSMEEAKTDARDEAYALRDRTKDRPDLDELKELSMHLDELKMKIDRMAYKRAKERTPKS